MHVTCAVSEGDSPLKITWLKDGKPLKPREANTHQIGEFDLALRIQSASTAHDGNYTCVASNDAAKTSRTASLLVHGTQRSQPIRQMPETLPPRCLVSLSSSLSLPPPPSQREKKLRESFQIEFLFFIHLARKTKIFFPSLYMCGFHFWNNISLYFGGIGYFLKSCHSPQNLESRGSRVERIFRTNLHIRVARPFLFP